MKLRFDSIGGLSWILVLGLSLSSEPRLCADVGVIRLLNLNFSAHANSSYVPKTGPAAVGYGAADVWNVYSRDIEEFVWRADGEVEDLVWSDGTASAISVRVTNAAGAWGTGSTDPMFAVYLYPLERIGNMTVTLVDVPAGHYDLLFYAHGLLDTENGVVGLSSAGSDYGVRSTTTGPGWANPDWREGQQFVRFRGVSVLEGAPVEITVFPGLSALPVMNGLQLLEVAPCEPPLEHTAGWWPGEETAADGMGCHDGELMNEVGFGPGVSGLAFEFNGDPLAVRIPYSGELVTPSYSVQAWIKPLAQVQDAQAQDLIFGQAFGFAQLAVRAGEDGLVPRWQYSVDGWAVWPAAVATREIPIGEFSHLVGTWDGSTLRLFIDGELDAEFAPEEPAPFDSQCDLYLGGFLGACGYNGQYFDGLIDEVTLFNRALTSAEVQLLYQAGLQGRSLGDLDVSLKCTPAVLWPPKRGMIPVQVRVEATDLLGYPVRNLHARILRVTSNEPPRPRVPRDAQPDWLITGDLTLQLRAERNGSARDRIYTIAVEVRAGDGEPTVHTARVVVPRRKPR